MNRPLKFNVNELRNKKIVAFGDSVTADATIGCKKTYPNLIKEKFNMREVVNYAIGGTTATYMFNGSNIEKEYTLPDKLFAVDGCRVVKKAVENNEINDAEIAFICYGHNDMFFQVPLDNELKNKDPLSLENCCSIKSSYRYMVNKIRSVNPKIKIIIINCTYSEYDKMAILTYGNKYSYNDYRKAIEEVSLELNCFYFDPWEYTKKYFGNEFYKDYIHLNENGHKVLFDYLISF